MSRAVIDIPRVGASHSAEEVYRVFTRLGWVYEMTGYLLQSPYQQSPPRIRTLCFQWRKSERPIYPEDIPCRAIE